MYVTIDLTDYTAVRNISFSPQTDVAGDSIPINEFSLDIITDDDIAPGQYVELHDDRDTLWAKYWLISAERTGPNIVRINARSEIELMEHVTLESTMYDDDALPDVLDEVMVTQAGGGLVAQIDYDLDSSLEELTVSGFCPEQTARERLQWLLFTSGAYLKTYFNTKPAILPIDDEAAAVVPYSRTYMRPKVSYSDYVTAVKIIAYTFTQATQSQAEFLADNSSYVFPEPWVAEETEMTLTNSAVPAGVADNIVEITGLYLINTGNASEILTRMAARYFKRTTVELEAIDNAEFVPGDCVTVFAGERELYQGYIEQAQFSFGVQAMARLKLSAVESVTGASLTINYLYSGGRIGRNVYFLPVGYSFEIENPYIDRTFEGRRYVYAPQTRYASGTVASGGTTVNINYDVALECYNGYLIVRSVDSVETVTTTSGSIGEIS